MAKRSPTITTAGEQAIDGWIDVITGVFANAGVARREARTKAQLVVAAMEGELILARVRQSPRPILDVAELAPCKPAHAGSNIRLQPEQISEFSRSSR